MVASYHFKLCRAILVGFRNQLRNDGVCRDGFVGMLEGSMEREDVPAVLPFFNLTNGKGASIKVQIEGGQTFKDNLTGKLLDHTLVGLARQKELEYFEGAQRPYGSDDGNARRRSGRRTRTS